MKLFPFSCVLLVMTKNTKDKDDKKQGKTKGGKKSLIIIMLV